MDQPEVYDLLILVDATYSMSDYLQSLQISLPKIIALSALTDCFSRIGLLAYRDYCDSKLLEWSGWLSHLEPNGNNENPDLISMAKSLDPLGGGDHPEAVKTGLAKAYEVMRPEATTIILLYTDAPPHSPANGDMEAEWSNLGKEKRALLDNGSYSSHGPSFADWVSASSTLHMGDKKAQVFCILEPSMAWQHVGHYNYLSTITRGACIYLKDSKPLSIAEVTVQMLLVWMGVEKSGTSDSDTLPAYISRYISVKGIKNAKNEMDPAAAIFFATTQDEKQAKNLIKPNITEMSLTQDVLKKHLPKKITPVQDFAKRYAIDDGYKAIAVEQLKKIINDDVSSVSLNPVFGSLWRAMCNDRENPARDGLTTEFGLQVDRIQNADEKTRMKAWLEESYDFTVEVLEAIESVPEAERYPCVLLDPTLAFVRVSDNNDPGLDEKEDNRPVTAFRRDELLEIGRSCDYKILRRLGRIFTSLTFVNSAEELPAHIMSTTDTEVPKIPMALISRKYGQKFWKILLHIVVPGTMLAARPAALLAALSIRLGVQPLLQAAEIEMLRWKIRWNNIEIPETWNLSCLSLLLDADSAYHEKIITGEEPDPKSNVSRLLKADDRMLFERLVEYKMLEINLHASLTAKVGWTPEKTSIPIGPVTTCRSCKYPRSVTVMSKNGQCGICATEDYDSAHSRERAANNKVSAADNEKTLATWVECFVRTCRAQYIVYNVEDLNVRPKCHYCRSHDPHGAPTLECKRCLNRMIWPKEYRPSTFSATDFECIACTSNYKTIIDVSTTASILNPENSTSWLIESDAPVFNGRSLFHTISTIGTKDFATSVNLFPTQSPKLTLKGKPIHNVSDLIAHLRSLTSLRSRPKIPCSLCLNTYAPTSLLPACRRHGCIQQLCRSCLRSWYGLNSAGQVINTAALFCPFCRRAPAAKTLASYGMGVHAVGGLKSAVEERGEWVFAWCMECGCAKKFVERSCVRGVPDVTDWVCDDCELMLEEMEEANEAAVNAVLEEQEQEDVRGVVQRVRATGGNRAQIDERAGHRFDPAKKRKKEVYKKCPGCGVLTQKSMGCNHVQCMMKGCGIHWCYACGWVDDGEVDIYSHMESKHGGIFGD